MAEFPEAPRPRVSDEAGARGIQNLIPEGFDGENQAIEAKPLVLHPEQHRTSPKMDTRSPTTAPTTTHFAALAEWTGGPPQGER